MKLLTYNEFKYRMLYCDECDCRYGHPMSGCDCPCHGPQDQEDFLSGTTLSSRLDRLK